MKKLTYLFALLILTLSSCAQNRTISKKESNETKKESDFSFQSKKCSPITNMFLSEYKNQKMVTNEMIEKYFLKNINGQYVVDAFISLESETDAEELKNHGVTIKKVVSNIANSQIPVEKIEEVSSLPQVKYIQIAEKVEQQLNSARAVTGVNSVQQGIGLPQGYCGNNVVVGIIDKGFDYTHPTFYDSTGVTYRIKRVWEQNSTGTPPSGFNYGKEIIGTTNILNAQRDLINETHGTHVAGIAAGGGVGTNKLYMGVAPASDIALVSSNFSTVGIADGIDYLFGYANSVGKPCVINMSIGSNVGPHDGTSPFDTYCNGLIGQGKVLVGSAGNYGSDTIHIYKSFTFSDTLIYSYLYFLDASHITDGSTLIDLWGNAGTNFWAAINIFNTSSNSFEDWTPYIAANTNSTFHYTLWDNDIFQDSCGVTFGTEGSNPNNGKPHISIYVDNTDQDDNYKFALLEIVGYGTAIHGWSSKQYAHLVNNGYLYPVINGNTSSTVSEIGGTGTGIITVGAFTSKNNYTDFNGTNHNIPFYTANGAIAPFSSKGPTADNRTKPDITAPGNVIVSSVSRFDSNYPSSSPEVVAGVTDGTYNWYFATMQGTSQASPMVTGIVALILQANPNLTASQIKQILKDNAITDSWTGTIGANGSNTWGWGKVSALQSMLNVVSVQEISNNKSPILIYPNPTGDKVHLIFDNQKFEFIKLVDVLGNVLITLEENAITENLELDLSNYSRGFYFLQAKDKNNLYTSKIIKQ